MSKHHRIIILLIIVLILITTCAQVNGNELSALQTIKMQTDKVISVLEESKHSTSSTPAQQREQVTTNIDMFFDFEEISKRTLGRNWNKLSTSQKEAFVGEFKKLLTESYIDRLFKEYQGQSVAYGRETPLAHHGVEVKTTLFNKGERIAVNYRLHNPNGQWLVYEILVENISLVQNYRSQFDSILSKETADDLIDRLKTKNQ